MRSAQFGIVIVMMAVRAAPNAVRTQSKDPEQAHDDASDPRTGQDGMMLLIVINHEKPEEEEAAEDAAGQFSPRIEIPVRPGKRDEDQKGRRENMPPTLHGGILCVCFGRKDQFATAS